MKRSLSYLLIATAIVSAGCSSSVTRSSDAALQSMVLSRAGLKAKAVNVGATPEMQRSLTDNLSFDMERLRTAVRNAVAAKGVLATDGAASQPTVDVTLTDFRLRSTAAAIIGGIFAGTDYANGDVVVKDPGGRELQRFAVNVSYGLGGLGGGQEQTRLTWLFDTFGQRVAEGLAGEEGATGTGK
jgi:hypothetical protein